MAVYTDVTDADLRAFMAGYDLGAVLSCKGIAEGVENSNYLVVTETGPFILTLYEKRVQPTDLPFFLGLMEHLAAKGLPCPLPVQDRSGQALQSLCGRPAAVISFLNGMWPKRIDPWHCAALGQVMAAMHDAAGDFPLSRRNDLSLDGWRALFAQVADHADRVIPGAAAGLERELHWLGQHWPDTLPTGIIHADLFPDNVFFSNDRLSGVIDFYFACADALAYDLAITLNAWCFEADGAFNATKARRLIAGYGTTRPLSDAEAAALPTLARGAALRFLLTRLYDWIHHDDAAFVTPKDPREYWHKLKFHQGVADPAAYGL